MKTRLIVAVAVVGTITLMIGLFAGGIILSNAYADSPWASGWCGEDFDRGMMGRGMMGNWGRWAACPYFDDSEEAPGASSPRSDAVALSIEDVETLASEFLAELDGNLQLAEVMEFDNHFYLEAEEKDTGFGAYELLVDRYSGDIYPEMGPNMMWNEKYGMHARGGRGMMGSWSKSRDLDPAEMPVTPEAAAQLAAEYLDRTDTGLAAAGDDVTTFYGYYTLHTLKDGKINGMLSVNGYDGDVWLHTWHGDFVQMSHDEEGESSQHDIDQQNSDEEEDVQAAAATYTDISAEELAGMLTNKDFQLINVHIPYEGEIRNTDLFIPYNEIADNLDQLPDDKDAPIVLYCRSDSMSNTASKTLADLGYTNVYNLQGGFNAWQAAGYDLLQKVQ